MNEKRFVLDKLEKGNAILSVKITDSVSDDDYFIMTKEAYEDDIDEIVGVLNEQQSNINKNKELLKLIANACSFNKEHSVKEIPANLGRLKLISREFPVRCSTALTCISRRFRYLMMSWRRKKQGRGAPMCASALSKPA